MDRRFLFLGSLSAMIAVALGAFGAHALRASITPLRLVTFETGVRYQMYHALALILVAIITAHAPKRLSAAAGWLFVAGTLFFSGSLYALALTGTRSWGAVAPIGGACFLAGWACLAWAAIARKSEN
jgi:uncharacterized membrane protein YgdD (TMEM256/DUF423 family)